MSDQKFFFHDQKRDTTSSVKWSKRFECLSSFLKHLFLPCNFRLLFYSRIYSVYSCFSLKNLMKTGNGQLKYCIPRPFSRCLISLCSSLSDFNSIFIFFDWSRSCLIHRWAKLIVQGFCSGFSSLGSQYFMYICLGYPHLTSFRVTSRCTLGLPGNTNSSANDMFYSNSVYYRWITQSIAHETERERQV